MLRSGPTVRTLVDGRERQDFPVCDMIFSPPCDVVEVSIDGIGTLRNEYRQA